ncbi:hypothetical protein A0H81_03587 [Grifola frondosa]|uniref:Uncharacterized protein n=1 Tax=Grifola frondosa TaxID=5627 RepID=A0A1C7MMI9_GRIFR|nr:hypothetical protein A0H81_03587 [Grifola frondosa]
MSGKPSEDTQPNEIRLARKGNAAVPIIRASWLAHPRSFPRGLGRGRGQIHYAAGARNSTQPYASGSVPTTSLPCEPGPSNLPKHDYANRPPQTRGNEWYRKRPRLDSHWSLQDGGSSSNHLSKKVKRKAISEVEVVVDLPKNCQKGAPHVQGHRRSFIKAQVEKLKREMGLRVIEHAYLDVMTVRFKCHPMDPALNSAHSSFEDIDSAILPGEGVNNNIEFLKVGPPSPSTALPIEEPHSFKPHDPVDCKPSRHDDEQIAPHNVFLNNSALADSSEHGPSKKRSTQKSFQDVSPLSPADKTTPFRGSSFRSGSLIIKSACEVRSNLRLPPDAMELSSSNTPTSCISAPKIPGDVSRPMTTNQDLSNCAGQATGAVHDSSFSSLHVELPDELLQFRKEVHDKPRRMLLSEKSGIICVTMRGSVDRAERSPLRRSHALRVGRKSTRQVVDDACLLATPDSDIIVFANARDDCQVSLTEVKCHRATDIGAFSRATRGEKRSGISAVCTMMQPRMFATGGYDHMVHLWTVTDDISGTSSAPLAIKHASLVQSLLAVRDTSHKLVSAGADCSVNIWDISSECVVNTLKVSNSVYHVHQAISPSCVLLELAHRELQFEVRDLRVVPQKPTQRFGYHTSKLHGRFVKGDARFGFFACGDMDGSVRLWDLRNSSSAFEVAADRAYDLQSAAAARGALRGTAAGFGLTVLAHYTWPFFRRQTLPFKAFVVSAFTVYGLVIGADRALLSHEVEQRQAEHAIRREARIDLARRGLVATETEIEKWRAAHVPPQSTSQAASAPSNPEQ